MNTNFLPNVTGLDLGSTSQQWDAFLQSLTVSSASVLSSILAGNVDNIRLVDGVAFLTIDAAIANLPAGGGMVIVPSSYVGAEASTAAAVDGISQSKTAQKVTVLDLRPASTTGYNVQLNSAAQDVANLIQTRLSVWNYNSAITPTFTTSAILGTNQITGVIPSASVAGMTAEVDTTGALTANNGGLIQALSAEAAVRSTGQTLSQVQGVVGRVNIDRSYATTNITQAASVTGAAPINTSSSGATITDAYAVIADGTGTAGTRNNYGIFVEKNAVWSDNDGIDVMNAAGYIGPTGQKLLRFGGDNNLATAGMNQYSTQYTGVPYKFFPSGHFSWMLGANANFSETFEITPSTASGGSTFTTPAIAFGVNGVTRYNGIATVANGLPSEYAVVDLIAQTAAIGTTTLYTTPSAGQYRLSWNMKITTAAGTSSTLGPLTIVYTDPDSVAVTLTAGAQIAAGTIATSSAANTTGTVLIGLPMLLNCKAATVISYATAYASVAAAAMNYNLHIVLERM